MVELSYCSPGPFNVKQALSNDVTRLPPPNAGRSSRSTQGPRLRSEIGPDSKGPRVATDQHPTPHLYQPYSDQRGKIVSEPVGLLLPGRSGSDILSLGPSAP